MDADVDIDRRLDRMESKLDAVGETLQHLARIDERLTGSHKRIDGHAQRLDALEVQVRLVDKQMAQNAGRGMVVERAAWVVFAAIVTAVSKFF